MTSAGPVSSSLPQVGPADTTRSSGMKTAPCEEDAPQCPIIISKYSQEVRIRHDTETDAEKEEVSQGTAGAIQEDGYNSDGLITPQTDDPSNPQERDRSDRAQVEEEVGARSFDRERRPYSLLRSGDGVTSFGNSVNDTNYVDPRGSVESQIGPTSHAGGSSDGQHVGDEVGDRIPAERERGPHHSASGPAQGTPIRIENSFNVHVNSGVFAGSQTRPNSSFSPPRPSYSNVTMSVNTHSFHPPFSGPPPHASPSAGSGRYPYATAMQGNAYPLSHPCFSWPPPHVLPGEGSGLYPYPSIMPGNTYSSFHPISSFPPPHAPPSGPYTYNHHPQGKTRGDSPNGQPSSTAGSSSGGRIFINGEDVTHAPEKWKGIVSNSPGDFGVYYYNIDRSASKGTKQRKKQT